MSIGAKIRKLRREKDITQRELGKIVGVAESTISLYESGRNIPDLNMMRKLAIFFNVSLDELAENDVIEDVPIEFSIEEIKLITRFRKLSPISRQSMLAHLDNMEKMDEEIEKAKNEHAASEVS